MEDKQKNRLCRPRNSMPHHYVSPRRSGPGIVQVLFKYYIPVISCFILYMPSQRPADPDIDERNDKSNAVKMTFKII